MIAEGDDQDDDDDDVVGVAAAAHAHTSNVLNTAGMCRATVCLMKDLYIHTHTQYL